MMGRRGFIGGLAAMAAGWAGGDPGTGRGGRMRGGLPPRRPDQQYRPIGPQGPVGSSSSTVKARRVIVYGPNDGVFVYNGRPASGNLLSSVNGVFGTDPDGLNATVPGNASYTTLGGTFVATTVWSGSVQWWTAAGALGPYTLRNQIQVINGIADLTIGVPARKTTIIAAQEILNTPQALVSSVAAPAALTTALVEVQGVQAMSEQTSAPPTPTGAGVFYVDSTGHFVYKGPLGTVTVLANP